MSSYLTFTPISIEIFSDYYVAARERLLTLVGLSTFAQILHKTYPCPGKTPDGAPLYTDTLWLGDENAGKVLALLAGTHGVEGFVGSAIELDHLSLIASGQLSIPTDTAVLVVHALTPWGYAWLRRCDEDGVDLNRNAVDFAKPLPENPGYQSLRNALFSANQTQRKAAFAEYENQQGRNALEMAISGGQYSDPAGPFFGGKKPAHGRLVTEDLMRQYSLHERDLAVIDLHSGLGPYGYGEIICDHHPTSRGARVAQHWYGDSVTLPALGTSSSVPKMGLMDYAWHDIMNGRSCHVTLEFGTYPTDQLFEVLLRDHQLWAQSDNAAERLEHSKHMRQHFCPDDDAWKAMVLFRARQVIAQALQGLSG
ncbi:hypothetical protein MGMO_57c00070 [Methyloglobulus morosus KoM1]|uniref:DUF2817 domain-containing protein n=1 Tax=Methyloglobulus morosus KoM1 TaxID=1116472 RepID=V5C1R9_9GAMM|nr:DUF2817 domain-containing protein [Methyloglobulus morosus]ESS72427.1 hypothetical protein MGMO_57c00070 [Methyloglobulus morosus KoM1]